MNAWFISSMKGTCFLVISFSIMVSKLVCVLILEHLLTPSFISSIFLPSKGSLITFATSAAYFYAAPCLMNLLIIFFASNCLEMVKKDFPLKISRASTGCSSNIVFFSKNFHYLATSPSPALGCYWLYKK